jgi:hypothetical protein
VTTALLEWIGRVARVAFFTGSGVVIVCGLLFGGFGFSQGGLAAAFVLGVSYFLARCWLSWAFNQPASVKRSDYAEWGELAIMAALLAFGAWAWWTGRLSL